MYRFCMQYLFYVLKSTNMARVQNFDVISGWFNIVGIHIVEMKHRNESLNLYNY